MRAANRNRHVTDLNVTVVDELVGPLSQEDNPQTHRSTRQTSEEMVLTQCSLGKLGTDHSPRSWSEVSCSFTNSLFVYFC